MNRRQFVTGLISVSTFPYVWATPSLQQTLPGATLSSAATDPEGHHWLISIDNSGQLTTKIPLPARAHEVIHHPSKPHLCVVARRPGAYLLIVDTQNNELVRTIKPGKGHHFYGHAVYSNDGRYLVTTENQFGTGDGRIVLRDTQNRYEIHKTYSSFGVGPHQIVLSPDSQTLIVANGGIRTHPEKDREKLNLDTMSPSLAYIDFSSGKLLELRKLPKERHQLSIRHIDVNQDGLVAIAMQYQGDKTDQVPLVAKHNRGSEIELLWAPDNINHAMRHYCGSIRFDGSGELACISSPKGNLVTVWDMRKGELRDSFKCRDACGISSKGEREFIISNGRGKVYHYLEKKRLLKPIELEAPLNMAWDNHLLSYS